ncbi:hypothetical protein HanXRQr2_Chr04g0183531 [Helianthus annuus]|uniref:Uncharacterized protein n=2 Tax=Helianthus annuus TaxID=4232 RepID=A0A9K3NT50_HELAN|nr:uncharacterized protein LOC110935194 [Helianthus annuus]KAF5811626.1 hypothetical protein HanXRQr2_Chr04g0183531 [Helianthus annuus]
MARGPARRSHFKINGIPATPHHSEFESEEMEKRFAKMRLSESKKKKKNASSPNKGNITVMEELADFVKMSPSHSYVTQVPRPPLLLVVYEQVKRIADIMDDPNWPSRNLQTDVDQAEYVLMVTCRHFRDFLPTGWRYAREHARSLIAGYGEVFTKDDDDLEYIVWFRIIV